MVSHYFILVTRGSPKFDGCYNCVRTSNLQSEPGTGRSQRQDCLILSHVQ